MNQELSDVAQWYSLGVNLGLSKDELDVIRQNSYGQGAQQYRLETLTLWYSKYPDVTWSDLLKGLISMGRVRIAEKLALKYGESIYDLITIIRIICIQMKILMSAIHINVRSCSPTDTIYTHNQSRSSSS